MKLNLFTASLLAFVVICVSQSLDSWIVRLPPTAFPELPENLVQELQRRQCTIPQEAVQKKPNNIIKGEFARAGQTDWAVLCSVKGVSTILVFWNGSGNNPAAIAPWEDSGYVQDIGGGRWGYSRSIAPVSVDDIFRYHDLEHLGIPLPPIEHQGINDAFEGKAFLVWYYFDGQWLKVAGGD